MTHPASTNVNVPPAGASVHSARVAASASLISSLERWSDSFAEQRADPGVTEAMQREI